MERSRRRLALLVCCTLVAAALPVTVAERGTLQDMLVRLREVEARRLESLGTQTGKFLADLRSAVEAGDAAKVARAQEAIAGSLPEAAPLFVQHLDPGTEATDVARATAAALATALARVPASSIHVALAQMAREGSGAGRTNALRVLPGTADAERVSRVLREAYESSTGAVRAAALEALAQLGREEDRPLMLAALRSGDADLARAALKRATEQGDRAFAPIVADLCRDPAKAAPLLGPLLAYLRSIAREGEDVEALLLLAESGKVTIAGRIEALRILADSPKEMGAREKRRVKDLAGSGNPNLQHEVYVTLAVLGDVRAKRDLLATYDERVERAPESASPYQERADVQYALRDWNKALADYRKAIQYSANEPRTRPEAYIGAARCSALLGKAKQAAEYLSSAPITSEQLRALADDPIFAEVRESRYGKVFGLPE